jgi:hypothetical protein
VEALKSSKAVRCTPPAGKAADQFMHLTEVVVGALGGVFAGEKLAISETQKDA